jgi:hypothetical protein
VSRLVRQRPAVTPADVGAQLHDAFLATQAAVAEGEAVVLCVDAPALLGQATPEDAAVACGLLGLARALAFEGGAKGWQVNVVAVDPGTEPGPELLAAATTVPGLTGQVLNVSRGAVGKVVP